MAEHRDWRGLVGDARLVAVLARPRHDDQVAELTAALPGAVIVRLDVRRPLRDLHVHLAAIGPVDALVDLAVAGASERREALGPHVRAPGQQTGVVPIIRDAEVARVLELDVGRGRVLETRPGASWTSAAVVRASGPMELNPLPATIEAPPLVLREWYDVVALPRQAVLSRDLLLPESFTTADGHRQRNPTVDKINAAFARPPRVPADLPGWRAPSSTSRA